MEIRYIWEHNGDDTLIYLENLTGAFVRGKNKDEALGKIPGEVASYLFWANKTADTPLFVSQMVQEHPTDVAVCDADSDVIFESEKKPLTEEEYLRLKALALKSAKDFQALYNSIPDKDTARSEGRKTFYGKVPSTAREMYEHTKSVNSYYFAEIGVEADNEPDILTCREKGFKALEARPDFLSNKVFDGSYGEQWSLRKVLRRFIWHDRIHAKAMWRMAVSVFGEAEDVFGFGI